MSYIDDFNKKIDYFKNHDKYAWLKNQADIALQHRNGFGYSVIASDDFIDRIIAMPIDYIQDWLDGKNELKWRKQDELKLSAIKGGFVDLHEQHPDVDIKKIGIGALEFYEGLGFKLLKEQGDCCFVGKIDENNWKLRARTDIANAMRVADSFEEYKTIMENNGYSLHEGNNEQHGRYITYTTSGGKKVKDYTLGENSTYEYLITFLEMKNNSMQQNNRLVDLLAAAEANREVGRDKEGDSSINRGKFLNIDR